MAWLGIIFHLNGYARASNSSCLDPFYSYLLMPKEKKNIWTELESNPGPLASRSQATALTTRQWLLAHKWQLLNSDACNQKPPKWSRNSSWCVRCLPDENYLMEKKFNIQQSFFSFVQKWSIFINRPTLIIRLDRTRLRRKGGFPDLRESDNF